MGNEVKCRVRFGGRESDGRALLETNEIIFRGDFRLKIPREKIRSAKVAKGNLHICSEEGEAVFELGAAAEKWCEKIQHPKSRIEKLGGKAGSKVALIGFGTTDGTFDSELKTLTEDISESVRPNTEFIFLEAPTRKELKQIFKITKAMRGAVALWVVYPKGQSEITEADVLAGGRVAGLKDVKVVGFSATHTALKFVIPVSRR